jgi:hypothetical protein
MVGAMGLEPTRIGTLVPRSSDCSVLRTVNSAGSKRVLGASLRRIAIVWYPRIDFLQWPMPSSSMDLMKWEMSPSEIRFTGPGTK